jgi:hypothetical protein
MPSAADDQVTAASLPQRGQVGSMTGIVALGERSPLLG